MNDELIARLRAHAAYTKYYGDMSAEGKVCFQAADALAQQAARIAFLEGWMESHTAKIDTQATRIEELELALVEADRKNEATLYEWNTSETRIAALEGALRVYAGPIFGNETLSHDFPYWADGYPGGVFVSENVLDFGDAARAALQSEERTDG